jgi:hypothetical protein
VINKFNTILINIVNVSDDFRNSSNTAESTVVKVSLIREESSVIESSINNNN